MKPFWIIVNLPDFTASPICNLDIVTDFPFFRETLADAGKQLPQNQYSSVPKLLV